MPLTLKPFVMKDVSLTLKRVADTLGTETEYKCQLTQAELVPSTSTTGGGGELETFCEKHTDAGSSKSTWELNLSGFQAFQDLLDYSIISFNYESEDFEFTLIPNGFENPPGPGPSITAPGFTGIVKMQATNIGGTAASHAVFSTALPCSSKPTMITA